MMRLVFIIAVIGLIFGMIPLRALELTVEPEVPEENQRTQITVTWDGAPVAGALVRALYRPNSEVSVENELGMTDSFGHIAWQPRDAGLVSLSAEVADKTASRNVSVRYHGVPWRGLIVLFLAALILFGGNARFVAKTLKAGS